MPTTVTTADLPKTITAPPIITIYGPHECPSCEKAITAFKRQKIAYTKIDLEDGDANHVYVKHTLGYSTAPVIIMSFDGHDDIIWGGHRMDMLTGLIRLIVTNGQTTDVNIGNTQKERS